MPLVPVEELNSTSTTMSGKIRLATPTQCYFKGDSEAQIHSKLFTFIDFGPGNIFLSACGTRHEPTVEEIVRILLEDPRKFFALADGRDKRVFSFCIPLSG